MSLGSHSRRAALKTLGATGAMAAFGGMGEVLAQAKVTIGVISSRQCHPGRRSSRGGGLFDERFHIW